MTTHFIFFLVLSCNIQLLIGTASLLHCIKRNKYTLIGNILVLNCQTQELYKELWCETITTTYHVLN